MHKSYLSKDERSLTITSPKFVAITKNTISNLETEQDLHIFFLQAYVSSQI